MNPEPLRVLIVDDSRIFRSALEDALKEQPGIRVVGSVWSGEKAVEFVRDSPPDLVTLDLNMPGRGGLETLSDIQAVECLSSRPAPGGGAARQRADRARGGDHGGGAGSGEPSTSSASRTGRTTRPMPRPAATAVVREDRSVRAAAKAVGGRGRPATEARRGDADRTARPVSGRRHRVLDGRSRGPRPSAARS